MDEIIYEVFAKLDDNKCIIDIWSTGNQALGDTHSIEDMQKLGYVKIDEGTDGTIYGYAQPNYLKMKYGKSLLDDKNRCNYKYVNKVIELTDKEKETFFQPIVEQPTEQEQFNAMILKELALLKVGA